MLSGSSFHSGRRVCGLAGCRDDFAGGWSMSSDLHVGAVDHHVGDCEFGEIERAADDRALAHLHRAVLGRDVDQAFDLGAGQHFVVRDFLDAEQAQHARDAAFSSQFSGQNKMNDACSG